MGKTRSWLTQHTRGAGLRSESWIPRLEDALAAGLARQVAALSRALRRGDERKAGVHRERLDALLREERAAQATLSAARELLCPPPPAPPEAQGGLGATAPTVYHIGSATLATAYAYLMRDTPDRARPEWMLAVTGLKIASQRTLETLIAVRLDSQSSGRAAFDMQHFAQITISLMQHGQALHGVFHSHRARGQPQPSSTDEHLQAVLEEGGYPAIQAIFSEDGFVRFYARRLPFAIEVYGKGAERVDEYTFRITESSAVPHLGLAT